GPRGDSEPGSRRPSGGRGRWSAAPPRGGRVEARFPLAGRSSPRETRGGGGLRHRPKGSTLRSDFRRSRRARPAHSSATEGPKAGGRVGRAQLGDELTGSGDSPQEATRDGGGEGIGAGDHLDQRLDSGRSHLLEDVTGRAS